MFSLESYCVFFSGFVLRFSNPFHVVDNKSLRSENTSKVDEVADEPVVENVKEIDVTTKGVLYVRGVIVVDFMCVMYVDQLSIIQ